MRKGRTRLGWKRLCTRGFSLFELIIVIGLLSLLIAFSTPSLLTLRSSSLQASGREFADFLNYCRSEAIQKRTAIRVGVVTKSNEKSEEFRAYAAWRWDKSSKGFQPMTKFHFLPQALTFEASRPQYWKQTSYARDEPSILRGDYVLENEIGEFVDENIPLKRKRRIRFLQFSPAGRASITEGSRRNLQLAMREGETFPAPTELKNWVHFSVDTLTGRTRIYRP